MISEICFPIQSCYMPFLTKHMGIAYVEYTPDTYAHRHVHTCTYTKTYAHPHNHIRSSISSNKHLRFSTWPCALTWTDNSYVTRSLAYLAWADCWVTFNRKWNVLSITDVSHDHNLSNITASPSGHIRSAQRTHQYLIYCCSITSSDSETFHM
jgi:hypothetical protein